MLDHALRSTLAETRMSSCHLLLLAAAGSLLVRCCLMAAGHASHLHAMCGSYLLQTQTPWHTVMPVDILDNQQFRQT